MRGAIAIAATLLAMGQAVANAQAGPDAVASSLRETATLRMARDGAAGAVFVLLQNGRPFWTAAFGMADPATDRLMSEHALFRVESLSKPVTAWAAMRLAEAGRLDLDAPAADCLVRWRPPAGTPPFTARQLLSQTAGLGLGDFTERYAPGDARPGLSDHLDRDFRMIAAPGARFVYSDTGYNLLELVIEDCADVEYAAFIEREVFSPLGMETATYDWPGPAMSIGHDLQGRPVAPYIYPGRGSGGLFATATDIARLAAASMAGADQTVLSEAGVETLHRPVETVDGLFAVTAEGYGLGHFTETLSDGRLAVWHGGQGYGWMSHMHLVPETGDGIVILSNSQRAWPLFAALLRVWPDGLGVAHVGMTRVLWAETAARVAIAGLVAFAALSVWLAWHRQYRPRALRVIAAGLRWP